MPQDADILNAANFLRTGGVVAFPTETVYGLGADATHATAVARVFDIKRRPAFDPLIVHLADVDNVSAVAVFDERARQLARRFWPGPLTLVLEKRDCIPHIVTAGLDTVGVRIPAHEMARDLIRLAGIPVAAPSANLFGHVSPTTAQHVRDQLGNAADIILDGGPCRVGVESTVLSMVDNTPTILRPGGVTFEELSAELGDVRVAAPGEATGRAPGQLQSHYAPGKRVILISEGEPVPDAASACLLAFRKARIGFRSVEVLSSTGNLVEAAANLFAALHRLDASSASTIYAECVPEQGLGIAIMDRLRRASSMPGT